MEANNGFAEFLECQRRQSEALEKLTTATGAMARHLGVLVADQVKVVLVYPWPNRPSIVRGVLVTSLEEERRLAELMPQFDTSARGTDSLEQWLTRHDFKPVRLQRISLGERYAGMFSAPEETAPAACGR
jgi:hypothetical protein